MSSLPLISHHLFVAAVAPEDRRRRPSRPAEFISEPTQPEQVVCVDLLEPESVRPGNGQPAGAAARLD